MSTPLPTDPWARSKLDSLKNISSCKLRTYYSSTRYYWLLLVGLFNILPSKFVSWQRKEKNLPLKIIFDVWYETACFESAVKCATYLWIWKVFPIKRWACAHFSYVYYYFLFGNWYCLYITQLDRYQCFVLESTQRATTNGNHILTPSPPPTHHKGSKR